MKMEKYRAWFGLDRALMAALAIMLCTAFPASAARTQTAPASQQTITRGMTSAPDDVGWQRTMTNGVKSNFNNGYVVDKVVTQTVVQMNFNKNSVNVAHGPDLRAVTSDHPRSAYVPYSYTLEKNPFSLSEEQEMRQLASTAERSWWCPSRCSGKTDVSFNGYDNSTVNVSTRPLWATLTRRE